MKTLEHLIPIKDFNDPRLDIFVRLPEVQLLRYREPAPGIFLAESPNVIERAFTAGYEPIAFLIEETALTKETIQHEQERQRHWEWMRYFVLQGAATRFTDDSVSLDDPVLAEKERIAVVLGTEGGGLAQETIHACDVTVRIPMKHGVDSLNVAAASAVAFWQLGRRA